MRHHLTGYFLRAFPYFLMFSCAVQIFAKEYSRPTPHKSNHWIYNIYSPIECVFYCLLLLEQIKNKRFRKLFICGIIAYCLFTLYNLSFLQGFSIFNSYTYVAEAILVVGMCFYFFLHVAKNENEHSLVRDPVFWITSALIITFLGDFIIMGLLDFVIANPGKYTLLSFSIIKYLNVTKCVLFSVAFVCKRIPEMQKQLA